MTWRLLAASRQTNNATRSAAHSVSTKARSEAAGSPSPMSELQQPGLNRALALDLDHAARLEHVFVLELLVDRARHLDGVGHADRFHAARQVHRVAPQVVDVLALADHAGHYGAAVDADPQLQR